MKMFVIMWLFHLAVAGFVVIFAFGLLRVAVVCIAAGINLGLISTRLALVVYTCSVLV